MNEILTFSQIASRWPVSYADAPTASNVMTPLRDVAVHVEQTEAV
jgi:hypothetical protein